MPQKKSAKGRTKSQKGTNALKEIVAGAKRYARDHPSAQWKSAIAHASQEYRAKHKK